MAVFCDTLNKLSHFISLALSFWMFVDMIRVDYYTKAAIPLHKLTISHYPG